MDRRITENQVERLYQFTRQHFVEYYDLQTELVDHLANAIEGRWQEQPGLDFEQALQLEFKKFGIFGFMNVVEKRQIALSKRYNKLIWSYFKNFMKLPQVLGVIVLLALVFQSFQLGPIAAGSIDTFLILAGICRFIYMNIKYKRKVKATGRRWMFEEIIFRCGSTGLMFYPAFQFGRYILKGEHVLLEQWFLAAILVLFLLYQYILMFVVPSHATKHLQETYPEYNLEVSN